MNKTEEITKSRLDEILSANYAESPSGYRPRGLFYAKSGELWLACDNSKGEGWLEEFNTSDQAVKWLKESEL